MKYLLIDANNLCARCFYASRELYSSEGFPTGGLLGFLRSLSWLRNNLAISGHHTAVVWDHGRAAFREKLFPDYKGGRTLKEPKDEKERKDKEDYQKTLSALEEILSFTDVKQIKVAGTEADDIISVLAHLIVDDGRHSVVVYTGDHDFWQIIGERIEVHDPKKGQVSVPMAEEAFCCSMSKIPLAKALSGDSSDNIPGIPQVGRKRAGTIAGYAYLEKGKLVATEDADFNGTRNYFLKAQKMSDVVVRNLKLMQLPKAWHEVEYTPQQIVEICDGWLTERKLDLKNFIQQLERYELESVLEQIGSW